MKINSYCFQKNELWYFRKKIPFLLNKKTPIYRVSLKKLLGKKSYYVSLLNASLFTITNYINNQVELLFLEVGSLSLEELNDYVIELLQKYEQKAIIRDNNYVGDIGKEIKEIEKLRFNALSYFDDSGTQFGGHTKIALQKELDELRLAYDTDNVGLYRKKARDILNRQNIITQEEISKIPENMILTFEENLVKKEMEVILQDINNYDNLLLTSPTVIDHLIPLLGKLKPELCVIVAGKSSADYLLDKSGIKALYPECGSGVAELISANLIRQGTSYLIAGGLPHNQQLAVYLNINKIKEMKIVKKNCSQVRF